MKIPTNPMYDIDEHGVVRLISTNAVIPEYRNHHGKRAVKIRGKSHKPSSHPLDRLMLLTYKPLSPDKDPEWMSVRFVDGNKDNIHISNLEWSDEWYRPNPLLGIDFGTTTWISVPNHPEIEVRLHNGVPLARCAATYREIGYKPTGDGYCTINIPNTQRRLRWHRVIALAFISHPIDTVHLTVNHRDSDKRNNAISNLEWATYTDNNFHSFNEGPRGETIRKIVGKNLATGQEQIFSGYHDMARYLGVAPGSAHSVMDRRPYEGRPYKGYVFKYTSDSRSWDELTASGPVQRRVPPNKIACMRMDTRKVLVYDNITDVIREQDITDHTLFRLLDSDELIPWRGRCFQSAGNREELTWPIYPQDVLNIYSNIHASDRPIKITDQYGSVRYYTNITSWSNEDRPSRCDPAVIARYIKHCKKPPCRWRDWVFAHIDLKDYPKEIIKLY